MKEVIIIAGGDISESLILEYLNKRQEKIIIAVDKGLESLYNINVKPDYIIGDFDSVGKDILDKYSNTELVKLNPIKDFTDTHMALKLAIDLKADTITILGATGKRIDHALANINIMKEALEKNIKCKMIDTHNEIQLINSYAKLEKNTNYKYISLIPLTTKAEGITLKGFKYLLNNATLNIGHSIGVSNEQVDDIASINVSEGILILIKSID